MNLDGSKASMINFILAYLNRPYPQLNMPWWKERLFTCGLVFLLFVIFEPFGIARMQGLHKWILIGGITLISAVGVQMPGWIFSFLFGKAYFEERNWTVGKNIFYNLFILLSIAIGIYLYISLFFSSHGFRLSTFFIISWNTLLIGIFPIGLITVIIENRNMARHVKEVAHINEHIRETTFPVTDASLPSASKIILPNGLKETLELEPNQLMVAESDGNYVKIACYQEGKLLQRSLRLTLKQVEDAFSAYPFIQKCHRAFVVNLHFVEKVKGNSQGYRLMLKGWDEEIPVARSYNKEIREKMAQN